MTNTPISDVKSYLCGNIGNTAKGQDVQSTESFSQVFDKTQKPVEKSTVEKTTKKLDDSESVKKHAEIQKNRTSENLKEQTEDVKETVDVEEMEQAAKEAAGVMVEQIAETFDTTVEEVTKVLEELGLTTLDLLNGENLTKVVLALHPEADAFTIMTNEKLFHDLKNLTNMAEGLKKQLASQFSVSEEQITSLLQSMKEAGNAEGLEGTVAKDMMQPTQMVTNVSTENVPIEVELVTTDVEKTLAGEKTGQEGKSVSNTVDHTDDYDNTILPKTEGAEKKSSDANPSFQQGTGQNYNQQFVNQLADAVDNAAGSSSNYGVNGQEILRQITDYIRVHANQTTTEMELQLHPASLGNIKVQIASTEGVLTAVFTTENEAVKAALEAQLVQLKDNFAQQGLKVESVEVNVSTQGFERSLDQQQQEQQNQFENHANRNRNRRIRLNGLEDAEDGLAEHLTEDDRIVADMMIRNGNSVDYTV